MSAFAPAAPVEQQAPLWQLFTFLKAEIAPQPGFYARLARVVLAVTLTFLIAATFRLPSAAVSLFSVFVIDRSSRRAALLRALESTVAITLGIVLALLGVILFADFPLLSFAYYGLELFLVAFLVRTTRLLGPPVNMALGIYSVHNVWERPYPASPHLEQTLWIWLTLCLGFAVSVLVEFAFVREEPFAELQAQLKDRLHALVALFDALAAQTPSASAARSVLAYAYSGTASVRQRIIALRTIEPRIHEQLLALTSVTALIGRLIDVSANIAPGAAITPADSLRLSALAKELARIRTALPDSRLIEEGSYQPSGEPSLALPFLAELERTAATIPTAFSAVQNSDIDPTTQLLNPQQHLHIFLPDAFANRGYRVFALKTMLAAMLCYVIYSALDWPGLSTSVVTCLATALNTVGATNQKQFLRLLGAICGGVFALAAIIFLLPEIDSITGVTLLIAAVTTFSGWFALTSQRLAYFGQQTALAFFLALIQDYTATTQLAPPRDRAFGVLLGISMMWLVFNHLWPISAAQHMQSGLADNLRLLARLVIAPDQPDRAAAILSIRSLRDQIQEGVATVHGHADSVLFEVGSPLRARHLALRDAVLRLQASVRTLFVVEIAIAQYRTQVVPGTRPAEIRQAQSEFNQIFARHLLQVAQAVEELRPTPDSLALREAYARFRQTVAPWDESLTDSWVKSRIAGIQSLSRQALDLTARLSEDWAWR